jgi:Holliday junction resolvase
MVDSRDKGTRAEYQVRDMLKKHTGLGWERVPGSGGFTASHSLKGDIYLPPSVGKSSAYTIEVKHYKETQITPNLFNPTVSILEQWLAQTFREASEMNAKPILVFKHDRAKWLAALPIEDADEFLDSDIPYIIVHKAGYEVLILLFTTWLASKTVEDLVK